MHTYYINTTVQIQNTKLSLILANDLIGDYCTRKRPCRVSSSLRLLPLLHFPLKSTSRKRGRCTLCCQSEKRTDTTWQCGECYVTVETPTQIAFLYGIEIHRQQ